MTAAERKSDIKLKTGTPYLALTGELWGVNYENFEENWPRYNGTALYFCKIKIFQMEISRNGALVTPNPEKYMQINCIVHQELII